MPEPTVKEIEQKLAKGEPLSKEETELVMSMPSDDAESNAGGGEEEKINWPEEGEEEATTEPATKKAEDTLPDETKNASRETEESAEDKQAEADAKDPLVKIEKLLEENKDRADEQVDLSKENFTRREKAYFWQMRRDREAKKKAEEERDAALFREARRNADAPKGKKEETPEPDPLEELKKRDPSDFLTAGEVAKIIDKITSRKTVEAVQPKGVNPIRVRYLQMCENETKAVHPEDYDAVIELLPEIILDNKEYLQSIAEAEKNGENPAEAAYNLIKNDPEFSKLFPVAETRVNARKSLAKEKQEKPETKSKTAEDIAKERRAKEAEQALKTNQTKTKTTGHVEGDGGTGNADTLGGYTVDQVLKMSDLQFAKLPKKVRESFLKQYG